MHRRRLPHPHRLALARPIALALWWVVAAAPLSAAARDATDPSSTPTLWRALRADGAEAFFLLGSVHLGRRSMLNFPPAVDDAYARADELVLEVGAEELEPDVMERLARRYALIEPPESLRDRVSADVIAELARYLESRGDSLSDYLQMQPWFIAQQIEAREAQRVGLDPSFGVDVHFARRAAQSTPVKSVIGLETAESQMQLLSWLPMQTQERLLADALAQAQDARNVSEDLVLAWQRGDDVALVRILYRPMHESPELSRYYQLLLFGRNETMAQRLASLARDGKLRFVVLGVGHLIGERGIPLLLRDYGFRVDAVRTAAR